MKDPFILDDLGCLGQLFIDVKQLTQIVIAAQVKFHWHNIHSNFVRRLEFKFDFRPPLTDPAVVRGLEPDLPVVADNSSLEIWTHSEENCVLSYVF